MALKRATLKSLGVTFLIFMLSCCIVLVVLGGIVYRFANPDFISNRWSSVSATLIACVVYAFFVVFLGFCAVLNPRTGILIIFEILLFLSLLFSLAIGIYALVAGSTSFPNIQLGCNAKLNGILGVWRQMDTYLINVDRALCSVDCPCRLTTSARAAFELNPNATTAYSTWTLSDKQYAATAFPNCSAAVQANVLSETSNNQLFPIDDFNPWEFANYMGRIEREFNCVGWCNVRYQTTGSSKTITFSKYLFSDINRGVPPNIGCIDQLISWLPSYLLAWGSVALVMVGVQIVLFSIVIMLAASRKNDDVRDDVRHERIEVVERH